MAFKITSLDGPPTKWTVIVNGKVLDDVRHVRLGSQWGTFDFGRRPEGFEGWAWRETGDGGVTTLPWTRTPDGGVLVGLVFEDRPNISDKLVLCAIGGFADIGEPHDSAQVRESSEESGLDTKGAKRFPGMRTNQDRLYFVGEGNVSYELYLPFDLLVENGDGSWRLRENAKHNFKKAAALHFLPWRIAVRETPDALARSMIAQLVAEEY